MIAIREMSPSSMGPLTSLLEQWVTLALTEDTTQALDRVLYEICRTYPRSASLESLESLVRAALAMTEWSDRALDIIDDIPPFEDARIERLRQRLRVSASRRCGSERGTRTIEQATQWARASRDPEAHAELAWWTGRLRYRQGRFDEAARQAASACRNALLEGRATWIERSLAYRLDRVREPDLELVEDWFILPGQSQYPEDASAKTVTFQPFTVKPPVDWWIEEKNPKPGAPKRVHFDPKKFEKERGESVPDVVVGCDYQKN